MHVEFLGIPRERVGISEVEIQADSLGQLLGTLATRFPAFGALVVDDRLHASIAANLNGDLFVADPDTPLTSSDHLLILSSDVGG
jgi:molybdopterin converting factor small subunit